MAELASGYRGAALERWRSREVDRDLRRKDREQLRAGRSRLRELRETRRARVKAALATCRAARLRVRERAKRARERLRAAIARAKEAAAAQCAAPAHEREAGRASVEDARAELHRLRSDIRLRRRAEGERRRPRVTAAEARGESDDEVRGNIPRELLPVFERVKRHIHAGPRRSRTEAFLEWVHDNSASVERYLNEAIERDVAQLEEQEAAHYANPRRRNPGMKRAGNLRPVAFGELPAGAVFTNFYAQGLYRKRGGSAENLSSGDVHPVHFGAIVYTSTELERAYPMRNPTKKRRNPYVLGGSQEGQLEPGRFVWRRRGIGNPTRPRNTHERRLVFFANMAKGALRRGDRAKALEWRAKWIAERKRPNPLVGRAPPGDPMRFASRRAGWRALADARPAATKYAAAAMTRYAANPGTVKRIREGRYTYEPQTFRSQLHGHVVLWAVYRDRKWIGEAKSLPEARALAERRNPLVRGFSRKSIAKNIRRERQRGVKLGRARAIAVKTARKAAKRKLGRIPKYLQKRNASTPRELTTAALRAIAAKLRAGTRVPETTQRTAISNALRAGVSPASVSSILGLGRKNPRGRARNPKRRAPGVAWWKATIYGPGGKVVHRQVARANPAQARAAVAELAKRHGRVALDGPFAQKPAC